MKSLPQELMDALDPADHIGHVKRIHHLKKADGSNCSDGKDACLSIQRTNEGWLYRCFRCGMRGRIKADQFTPNQVIQFMEKDHLDGPPVVEPRPEQCIALPWDVRNVFVRNNPSPPPGVPAEVHRFLLERRIDTYLMDKYKIMYSPSYNRIIFPIKSAFIVNADSFGYETTLGWIGRTIGVESPTNPKWLKRIRKGYLDEICVFHALGKYNCAAAERIVVLVEDTISAIRVSEAVGCHAIAMMGTHLKQQLINRLRGFNVVVWLDADAYTKGLFVWNKLNRLGLDCKHLYTEKDPKDYSDANITEMLRTDGQSSYIVL